VSHEREAHRRHEEPASEPLPVVSTPAIPPAPPAAIHAVSEHDAAADESEAHRPVRRRRQGADHEEAAATPSLQMVETQAPTMSAPPVDDELPRRTKPRRRRGGATQEEPLQMVETQPGSDSHADGTPAP